MLKGGSIGGGSTAFCGAELMNMLIYPPALPPPPSYMFFINQRKEKYPTFEFLNYLCVWYE
jgi:hypothetical protein